MINRKIIYLLVLVLLCGCNQQPNNKDIKMKIIINNKTYDASLEDNLTVNELLDMLPITITMNDLNDNEKYYYFSNSFTTNSESVKTINRGDIMLFGNNCLVLFYETIETNYQYTKIGHIDNNENLKNVLGNNSIEITLEK